VRLLSSAAGRATLAIVAATLLSFGGVFLVIYTGSLVLGWILVPGGMLALQNMQPNSWAWVWFWGGAVGNLAAWTLLLYIALDIVATPRSRREPVA